MPLRDIRNHDEYPTWFIQAFMVTSQMMFLCVGLDNSDKINIVQRTVLDNDMGLIFVFNLIVGTGALTLPSVFAKAGWALGVIIVIILAFISYITVTFIIEAIACANAIMHWRRLHVIKNQCRKESDFRNQGGSVNYSDDTTTSLETVDDDSNLSDSQIEVTPLFSQNNDSQYYVLDNKIELGEMATLFFNNFGRILFYICIAIYLYGDLSIYSAAISKSMRDVICDKFNSSVIDDDVDALPCWKDRDITRLGAYRFSLIGFVLLLGPFVFFNVSKTKYIQILTILLRWLAFTIMIGIALQRLITEGKQGNPPVGNLGGVPALFGACVYSFMCHHSLPSLLAPINNKQHIKLLLSYDYILICGFYLLLALTGAFAFAHLNDLYTLNFVPNDNGTTSILMEIFEYFLALFPVFTLSASFPIIAITLRNNLEILFFNQNHLTSSNFCVRRILFPLMAIMPPVLVTLFNDSVKSLVGFTGSYAGTGIQYLIPIALVYHARKTCSVTLGHGIVNEFASPFKSNLWLIFVIVWSMTCVIFVTVNFFL